MTGILNLLMGVGGALKDQYFNLVSLLLPGNGTNGATNNSFLDSSSNTFTVTRNGNSTQGSFSPFSQTGWSNYYNGSGYFSSSTALFAYTTGNASTQTFTIEAMVYHTARTTPIFTPYSQCIAGKGNVYMNFGINGTGNLIFLHNDGTERVITSSSTVPLNTWTYVAVVVSGGTATMYIGNSSVGSGTWYGIASGAVSSTSYFGKAATAPDANVFQGYISNLRVSSVARTAAIPTSGYTNDANTVFLFNSSNQFVDKSSNGYTITVASSGTSVVAFSPFAPTASYSTSVVGGSGYFDGNGDYLSVADNAAWDFGSGNFTVECWFYPTTSNAQQSLIGQWDGAGGGTGLSWLLFTSNDSNRYLRFITSTNGSGVSFDLISTTALVLNTWNHVAIVRNGDTFQLYLNGIAATGGSTTSAITLYNATNALTIGATSAGTQLVTGYLSNIRIVKGQALASGNFTPPSAPVTSSAVGWTGANAAGSLTGTVSLLLNFTNGAIFDATAKNDLETVGNAQISTAQSKWGGSSMYFDGSANTGLRSPTGNLNLFNFGTGAFTIEFWARFNSVATDQMVFGLTGSPIVFAFYTPSAGTLAYYLSSNGTGWDIASGVSVGAITTGVWYRVALVRSGNTFTPYLDTTAGTPTTSSASLAATGAGTVLHLGQSTTLASNFNGYLDDVRVTRGVARDMTVLPTAPFPIQ